MAKGKFSKINYGWNYNKELGPLNIFIGRNKLHNSSIAIIRFNKNILNYYNDGYSKVLSYNNKTLLSWGLHVN